MEVFKASLITIIQQEASILEVSSFLWVSLSSVHGGLFLSSEAGERNNESERGTMGRGFLSKSFVGPLQRRECKYCLLRNCSNGKTRLAFHKV